MKIDLSIILDVMAYIFNKDIIESFSEFFMPISSSIFTIITFMSFVFTISHQNSIYQCDDLINKFRNKEVDDQNKFELILNRYKMIYDSRLQNYKESIKIFNGFIVALIILWIYLGLGVSINSGLKFESILVIISTILMVLILIFIVKQIKKISSSILDYQQFQEIDYFLKYMEININELFMFYKPSFNLKVIRGNNLEIYFESNFTFSNFSLVLQSKYTNDLFIHIGIKFRDSTSYITHCKSTSIKADLSIDLEKKLSDLIINNKCVNTFYLITENTIYKSSIILNKVELDDVSEVYTFTAKEFNQEHPSNITSITQNILLKLDNDPDVIIFENGF